MKKVRAFVIILLAMSVAFTACGNKNIDTVNSSSNADSSAYTEAANDTANIEESATLNAETTTEKSTSENISSAISNNPETSSIISASETTTKKGNSTTATTALQSAVTTSKSTEASHTTTKPNISTTKPNTTTTTTVPTTAEQPFDINYWVNFAKSYAQSVGLTLDNDATSCWDNPINANSKCKYLERDIKDRLNRYSRDDDITCVWIWAEKVGNNSYQIYIGYA